MYKRSQNDNGTYNTQCLHCFITVASAVQTPEELEWVEKHHLCPEKALSNLLIQENARAPHSHHHR